MPSPPPGRKRSSTAELPLPLRLLLPGELCLSPGFPRCSWSCQPQGRGPERRSAWTRRRQSRLRHHRPRAGPSNRAKSLGSARLPSSAEQFSEARLFESVSAHQRRARGCSVPEPRARPCQAPEGARFPGRARPPGDRSWRRTLGAPPRGWELPPEHRGSFAERSCPTAPRDRPIPCRAGWARRPCRIARGGAPGVASSYAQLASATKQRSLPSARIWAILTAPAFLPSALATSSALRPATTRSSSTSRSSGSSLSKAERT